MTAMWSSVVRSVSFVTSRGVNPLVARLCSGAPTPAPAPAETPERKTVKGEDRTKVIPVETSIAYLKSTAYATTYGGTPVWKLYRRNHKGQLPPRKTRRDCVRAGKLSTGNPCPICRDEYLVLDEQNVDLLKQFVSPHTGRTLPFGITGLCQKKHERLLVVLGRARDQGRITFDVPFR